MGGGAGRGRLLRRLAVVTAVLAVGLAEAQESPAGNPSSIPKQLTSSGNALFFTADDGLHGRELWVFEPGAGDSPKGQCRLAGDLAPGPADSLPIMLRDLGGFLYFIAASQEVGAEVFFWDPQAQAIRLVQDIWPGQESSSPTPPDMLGGRIVYLARPNADGFFLWGSTPGRPGAEMLVDTKPLPLMERSEKTSYGSVIGTNYMLFWSDKAVCATDGTQAGTRPICELSMLEASGISFGGYVLLMGGDGEHGQEWWVSDGTMGGTRLLKDIFPGNTGALNGQSFKFGDSLFFGADDGKHGFELWKTDGTTDGTVLVKDINPGNATSDPHYFCTVGSWLYFVATDDSHGLELWRTDGTEANTSLVVDMHPGPLGSDVWSPCEMEGRLFFCVDSPEYGEEIFVIDKTDDAAELFKDIVPGTASSGPANLTALGATLYFTCNDGIHGEELWQSDGTAAGTQIAADIALPRYNPSASPKQITALGDRVVFTVSDVAHGEEIWISDGSEPGTALLKDIVPGPDASSPQGLVAVENRVFFSAHDPQTGRELWATTGTPEDTRPVADIAPGPAGAEPLLLTPCDNGVYFTADDGVHGREVWYADGTGDVAALVHDIAPGPADAAIAHLFTAWNRLYAYFTDDAGSVTLWTLTRSQARAIMSVPRICSYETIPRDSGVPEAECLVAFVQPFGRSGAAPVAMGAFTYFAGRSQAHGAELWRTDGTFAGTQLVCDLFPGPASSSPSHMTVIGAALYFVADYPRENRCLWRTDGTKDGTCLMRPTRGGIRMPTIVCDDMVCSGARQDRLLLAMTYPHEGTLGKNILGIVRPGTSDDFWVVSGHPLGGGGAPCRFDQLTSAGDQVFFVIDDGCHGEELWVTAGAPETPTPNTSAHLVKDILLPADLRALRR